MSPPAFLRRLPAPVKEALRPIKNRLFPNEDTIGVLTQNSADPGIHPVPAPVAHPVDDASKWFWDHFDHAASEVITFLRDGGWGLEGKTVADIGCGEGLTDLGLFLKANPASLIGFDINDTSPDRLLIRARAEGAANSIPPGLRFVTSQPVSIPAEDASFDVAFSWSAFEHVQDPLGLLKEIRRILKPDGVFMLQLWPFYHSRFGSHMWEWLPEGFDHLHRGKDEIERIVRANPGKSLEWAEMMLNEFKSLNQITVDQLQRAIIDAGFRVSRFQLMTYETDVPREVADEPLSLLGISGVKLLAVPN